jgi:RimJ/RimL family protein N-acetyltransferase
MVSTSSTVKIERLTSTHVDAALQAARESVEDIYRWMEWCRPGLERSEVASMVAALEDAWDKGVAYAFVVIESATGEFLGSVTLNRIDQRNGSANLNYWIRSSKNAIIPSDLAQFVAAQQRAVAGPAG